VLTRRRSGAVGEVFQASFAEPPIVLFLRPAKKTRQSKTWKACCGRWLARAGIAGAADCLWRRNCGDVAGFWPRFLCAEFPMCRFHHISGAGGFVGGRQTGVNLPEARIWWAVSTSAGVFADIGVLATLPERELRAGLMESVKAGLSATVRWCAIWKSTRRGAGARPESPGKGDCSVNPHEGRVVNQDERERGLR